MKYIVTGAAGVLGQAVVRAIVAGGGTVAAIDRVAGGDISPAVHPIACTDLADPADAAAAVRAGVAALGGVDALVHVAGAFEWVPVEQSTRDLWRALYRSNVETAVAVAQACLPHLGDGASMAFVSAASAQPADAGMAAYAAAKSGVARLVEALSAELKSRGIRVNALLPAIIDTPRNRADMPDADFASWTSPAAAADALLFLSSDAARAINGALIPATNNR
ncbi:MAG: hypothetical protein BVN33_07740 [Proteobacteria bacterium ST_bin13]|jgi:NAD(P)-dependent dehydrogenase (short-subunit alcohol dehydrogenase family)|nr:MAG: hypothetical protein BVN33_07740 [Proteobacteria bacterium ST_bin13]